MNDNDKYQALKIVIVHSDDSYESSLRAIKQKKKIIRDNNFVQDNVVIETMSARNTKTLAYKLQNYDVVFIEKNGALCPEDIKNFTNEHTTIKTY